MKIICKEEQKTEELRTENLSYKVDNIESENKKDPESFKKVLKLPKTDQQSWFQTMKEEIESLKENEVYELTEGKHAVECKWGTKTKFDGNVKNIKYKARLVTKGKKDVVEDLEKRY